MTLLVWQVQLGIQLLVWPAWFPIIFGVASMTWYNFCLVGMNWYTFSFHSTTLSSLKFSCKWLWRILLSSTASIFIISWLLNILRNWLWNFCSNLQYCEHTKSNSMPVHGKRKQMAWPSHYVHSTEKIQQIISQWVAVLHPNLCLPDSPCRVTNTITRMGNL